MSVFDVMEYCQFACGYVCERTGTRPDKVNTGKWFYCKWFLIFLPLILFGFTQTGLGFSMEIIFVKRDCGWVCRVYISYVVFEAMHISFRIDIRTLMLRAVYIVRNE